MKTEAIKHSKGEWDVIHIKTEEGFKKGTIEHYFQVVTKKQEHDNYIAQANANLIAASRHLLEALEIFVDPENNEVYLEFCKILKKREQRKIEAAIKKAKGL